MLYGSELRPSSNSSIFHHKIIINGNFGDKRDLVGGEILIESGETIEKGFDHIERLSDKEIIEDGVEEGGAGSS